MNKLTGVTFELIKPAPSVLKKMVFLVDTLNKVIARKKAIKQLEYDLMIIAMRFNCTAPDLFKFYTTKTPIFSLVPVIEA